MNAKDTLMDDRFRALDGWLRARLADAPLRIERASTDASFRRYFRVFLHDRTLIAMDAPPAREDSRPFVKVAGLLREAGLNAPVILEADFEQGFLLVTDLIRRTWDWEDMYSTNGVLPNHVNLWRPQAYGAFSIFNAFSTPAEPRIVNQGAVSPRPSLPRQALVTSAAA